MGVFASPADADEHKTSAVAVAMADSQALVMAPRHMHGELSQSLAARAAEAAAVASTPYEGAFARAAVSGELQLRQPLHISREDDEGEFAMRIRIKEARIRQKAARRASARASASPFGAEGRLPGLARIDSGSEHLLGVDAVPALASDSDSESSAASGGSTLSELRAARDDIDDDFLMRLQPLRAVVVSFRATNAALRNLPAALLDSRATWPRTSGRLGRPHDEPVSKAADVPQPDGGKLRARRRSSAMDHMPFLRRAAQMRRMSYKLEGQNHQTGAGAGSAVGSGMERARRMSGAALNQASSAMKDVPHLPRLQVLEIRSNRLATLPHTLGASTPSLRSIDASANALVTLPRSMGALDRLLTLDVSSNRIDRLPGEAFANLRSLRRLNLSRNRLDTLPVSLGRLPRLRWLNIGYNRFLTLPSVVGGGAPLEVLMANNNRIATIATEVCGIKTLRVLQLSGNSIFGLPRDVGLLAGLESLWLDWNRIDRLPIEFAQLRNTLKDLRMEGNPLKTPPPDVVHAGVEQICDWIEKVLDDGIDRRKRRVARQLIGVLHDAVTHCLVDPSAIACNVPVDRVAGSR